MFGHGVNAPVRCDGFHRIGAALPGSLRFGAPGWVVRWAGKSACHPTRAAGHCRPRIESEGKP